MRNKVTLTRNEWILLPLLSLLGIGLGLIPALGLDVTEMIGFVTGALCVWLVVRQHMANWPIGLLNNLFFAFLFWRTRLFGEVGLQAVYFGLGIWGWWNWRFGSSDHDRLPITRIRPLEILGILIALPLATWAFREGLLATSGSAPFWDAFTTAISLTAQYLLCRKRLENWFFWIIADIIYVPLYFTRGLPVIAVLYFGFLILCILGLRSWIRDLKQSPVT